MDLKIHDVIIYKMSGKVPRSTFDNSGEFIHFAKIEDVLDIEAYFCDPHSPWQRGGIENTNGIIRRDMPRKTDIKDDSDQDIDDITWNLNTTPRESLGFRTPAEAFFHNLQNYTLYVYSAGANGVSMEVQLCRPPKVTENMI